MKGSAPDEVLSRVGWARSVGGVGPYLTLFARTGLGRAEADQAVRSLVMHELPSARGCTYVVPAEDFALALAVADAVMDREMQLAVKLGVTEDEVTTLCARVLDALGSETLLPDQIRDATGDASRSLGEAGRRKGLGTTLPLALGRLQRAGEIRRVPINGRLDQQRYGYTRWRPNPRAGKRVAGDRAHAELARRFFRWAGPATLGEWQWFSGLGVRAARAAAEALDLEPAWAGGDRLLLPGDAEAFRRHSVPRAPTYALVSSLDPLIATRRALSPLIDPADAEQPVSGNRGTPSLGALSDLPSHAIVDRGRLIGLWEYDPAAEQIVWMTFSAVPDASLRAEVRRTEAFVRDELGDARSFSLDSPASRQPRLVALRSRGFEGAKR